MIFEKIPLSALTDSDIYLNPERKTMDEIKKETGCTHIINGGFYDMETFEAMNSLVVDGKVINFLPGKIGVSMKGNKVVPSYDNQVNFPDHVSGYPTLVANGVAQTNFPQDLLHETQHTVIGFTDDAIIIGIFRTPISLTEIPDIMIALGCTYALNLDGGLSTQCDLNGKRYFSTREVHNYILFWATSSATISLPKKEQTQGGDNLDIIQDLIPKGRANRPGKSNPCKYITLHDTGNTNRGAGAKNHAKYLKGDTAANAKVSYHYTVDDTCIVQHLPDNESAFHAGDGPNGPGNTTSIGVEICINSDGNLTAATDRAARLVAHLCKKHNVSIDHVVQHNYWNGKNCPRLLRAGNPYSWDTFLAKVKKSLETPVAAAPKMDEPSAWAVEPWKRGIDIGLTDGSRPRDAATREEVVTMILRAIDNN